MQFQVMSECHYRFNLITSIFNINRIILQELMPRAMIPRLCANNSYNVLHILSARKYIKPVIILYLILTGILKGRCYYFSLTDKASQVHQHAQVHTASKQQNKNISPHHSGFKAWAFNHCSHFMFPKFIRILKFFNIFWRHSQLLGDISISICNYIIYNMCTLQQIFICCHELINKYRCIYIHVYFLYLL